MVAQRAEVATRVGEQPVVDVALDDLALDLEARAREVEQRVELRQQPGLVARVRVAEARAVDGHDAERPGLLGGPEEAVAALEQLGQVELQAAAHRAHHVGLELGVEEVLEVRQTVLRRHREEQVGVLGLPREVRRDVVRGDREGEDAALGVAGGHDLDVGAVDHVHLALQLAVGEVALDATDDGALLGEVLRARPVEGEVGERRLGAPARRDVQVVDELLDRLEDLVVGEVVEPDERSHVGVERRERLRSGPLVLQRAEEVHDLPDRARQVLGRSRLDLAGHAVEALGDQRAERPASAVAGEHVEVVDVDVALAVRRADLGRIDVREPVVRDDLAGDVEDETAERVALVGVGVDAPVGLLQVLVHRRLDLDDGLLVRAQPRALLAVDDVGARGREVVRADEHLLDDVLDLLDVGVGLGEAVTEHLDGLGGEQPGLVGAELTGRGTGALDRRADLLGVEGRRVAVASDDGGRHARGSGGHR